MRGAFFLGSTGFPAAKAASHEEEVKIKQANERGSCELQGWETMKALRRLNRLRTPND
jgi:hypothetical protein